MLRFHDDLVRRKYRALFSPHVRGKPGPKGPSQELIHAIVELKRRNPRFGYPHIALIISKTFGIEDADMIGYTKAKSEGFTAQKNDNLVATPPKKMKNNGFLKPRS